MKRLFIMRVCILLFFCMFFYLGCSKSTPQGPKEPEGKAVSLTKHELQTPYIKKDMREWFAWHTKGAKLTKQKRFDEALYCLHQALKSWPKEGSSNDKKSSIVKHRPEATDTILLLGTLYMKMNKPDLALYYFKKFKSYFPYDATIDNRINKAQKAMGK